MSNNAFLGNWNLLGPSKLSFDYKIIHRPANGAALPYDVRVFGADGSVIRWTSPNPDTATGWVHFDIPIQPSSFEVLTGTYTGALQNVTSLKIRVRIFTNSSLDIIMGLDNINLRKRQDVFPTTVNTVDGLVFSGSLSSLTASDDVRLEWLPDDVTLVTRVQMLATSPVAVPSEFRFLVESLSTRPGLARSIRLKNMISQVFDQMDGRVAPVVEDTCEIVLAGSAPNYIGPSQEMQAEITWAPVNDEDPSQDGWITGIDVAKWQIL